MRRPFALALVCLLCIGLLAAGTRRVAAQEPSVRLTLREQSPSWNDPSHQRVALRVRAENTGQETLGDLSIGVTLWPPVFSRTAFEESLEADPADAAALLAETRPRDGTLAAGEVRDFFVPVELPVAQLSSTQTLVYPLKIDLRSGYRSLAAIRTPVIYLVRRPTYPLAFSWTVVLHAQLTMEPNGTFASTALESSISPGGRVSGLISALSHVAAAGKAVDVVVSPLLVYQLQQMRDGYRVVDDDGSVRAVPAGEGGSAAAATALARLGAVARSPNVELSALPYSEPLLPAIASGRLASDFGVQLLRGRELVADSLGRQPSTTLLRPPRSAIDEPTLDRLAASGVSTLILDPWTVPRAEDDQGFALPPTVTLAAQNGSLSAVVADAAVQSMLGSGTAAEDPVLAAQAMLGELASIWLQRPGEPRGLTMTVGEELTAPATFYLALARRLADAPWLAKRTASSLVADPSLPRTEPPAEIVPRQAAFSTSYVAGIKRTRRRIETLRQMLVRPSKLPDYLDRLLFLAESQRFVGDELTGAAYIARADNLVDSVFGAVQPQVGQPITLTSSAIRNVPIAVRNAAPMPLRVIIRLSSPHLQSPSERMRVIPAHATVTVGMDLELKTTGRFEVDVHVLAPSGTSVGHETLVVRSTAYNRVALVITVGAAMLALLVWARRFVPRRTG